LMVWEWLWL